MKNSTPANRLTLKNEAALRDIAIAYPEAHEDFPWGERAIKVRGKVFLFLSASGDGLGLSTKLPQSGKSALLLPFAEPTHYGLGKSGWVSARFGPKVEPPLAILRAWIDESYRAVAPKKLVATLGGAAAAPAKKVTKKPAAKRKSSSKRTR
jgi:predicted DNA-binding protein (MmcQ/YjbR family)